MTLYLIYNVNYNFTFGVPSSYLILFALMSYTSICILKYKKFPVKTITPLLFSALLLSWSILGLLINDGVTDNYLIRLSFMYFIISMFSYSFYVFIFKHNKLLLLNAIGLAGFINSILIVTMLIIKPFQLFYLQFINQTIYETLGETDAVDGLISLRMVGITGFSAYTTAFVQMLCAICFLLYVYYKNNNRVKLTASESTILVLIIASAVFSARSSFIGIVFFIVIFLKLSNFSQLIKFISISSLLLFSIIISTIILLPDNFKDFFVKWVFELFTSGTQSGSLNGNLSMFKFSWSDFSLLGDSRWHGDNNDYYMNVDIGWYRILFSVGYIGLFLWILNIISIVGWKNIFSTKINEGVWVSIIVMLYIIIMNFKGAILFDSFQSILILSAISIAISEKKTNSTT